MQFHDIHNRKFRSLRMSLTDRCNLACLYCVSDTEAARKPKSGEVFLKAEDFCERVLHSKNATGLYSVRLTGGEPILYRDLLPLIILLKKHGIERVYLTTNGSRLESIIKDLQAVGLDGINTKLNCTVYGGVNENQILSLLEYAGVPGIRVRFLELMNMGPLYGCLSADRGFSFTAQDSEDTLAETLQQAMNQKQIRSFTGSSLIMKDVGG